MIRRPPRSTLFPYTTLSRSPATGPSRRSVKVARLRAGANPDPEPGGWQRLAAILQRDFAVDLSLNEDRKSTRLNSSHANISYAVFCLKKKNTRIRLQIVSRR